MNWISVKYRKPSKEEFTQENKTCRPIIICRKGKEYSEPGFFDGDNFITRGWEYLLDGDVQYWAPFPKCPAEHPPIPWEAD